LTVESSWRFSFVDNRHKPQEVRASALALPRRSREKLAAELIGSLQPSLAGDDTGRTEAEWKEEAQRRSVAVERGQMKLIPGEVVMKRLRHRIK
jgi:putative addiction module component (TIGR02574 family)